MIWNKNNKHTTKFCPHCQEYTRVDSGSGILGMILGVFMFYLGAAPGKKQSQLNQCRQCKNEFPSS